LLLWDDLVSGFGVRLTPNATSFVVQWREPNGRKPRESLRPRFPQLSAQAARDRARRRLGEVRAIADTANAQELRHAMRAWFYLKSELVSWRPRYRAKVDALIRMYVEGEGHPRKQLTPAVRRAIEELGAKPVATVHKPDLVRVVDGISRGAGEQFLAIISSFYNDMVDQGVDILNPARNRQRLFGGRNIRSRALVDAEVVKLWRALEEEGDPALTTFAVLTFTGVRRREATRMERGELDLDGATWTLPPERRKTGKEDPEPFVIHLHPHLVEMLRHQPVLAGSPHVFWGRRHQRPFEFHHALMQRLRALDIEDWRLDDVRRYVRSGMVRLGVPQMVAELCLGHRAQPGLVAVYDTQTCARERRAAWQQWGDYLVKLLAS
jgi:integrase